MPTKNIPLITAVILLTLAVSCSAPFSGSPKDSDIEPAVKKAVAAGLTGGFSMNPLWQPNEQVKVNSVKVLRRGDFNDAGKYYAIQASYEGSLIQKSLEGSQSIGMPPSRNCTFSGTEDFRVAKNDYGEWVAQSSGRSNNFKSTCDKQ